MSFCTVLIYCISRNVAVNFKPTLDMKSQATESFMKFGNRNLYVAVLHPAITWQALFLSIIQMVLSLVIRPVYVFIIMFIWLVASAHKKSWSLVGNLGMP